MDDLLLLSGNEIPFPEAQINIHQPKIKEIAYVNQNFFIGCQYLTFNKENLNTKDKNLLENFSDFQVLMKILSNDDISIKKNKIAMELVLLLLFPGYQSNFLPNSIMLFRKNQNNNIERHIIDENNFKKFKGIIEEMFCLNKIFNSITNKYNPGGPQAAALVQKFRKRQQKIAELKRKKDEKPISIFSQYISILSVGLKKDMNELLEYTIYQLFDEFERFKLKEEYDLYVKAKMAGAKDLEEIKNWMGNIHSQEND